MSDVDETPDAKRSSAASEPMIKVRELTIGWGPITLMKDVSFDVAQNDIFVILGGSGCGKSTLLRHLIGLETAKGGTIDIKGRGTPKLEIAPPPCGVMFQSGALFGSMTLAENVALPLRRWTDLSERDIDTVVRDRLRLVSLDGFENHLPAEISGGMKKRAGIARSLALEPDMLFLDEPSAGLDPISAVELDDLILTLNSTLGVTTVLVTHELESIFKVAKSCVMLDKQAQGAIAHGDPRWLRDHSDDERVTNFFNRRSPTGAA